MINVIFSIMSIMTFAFFSSMICYIAKSQDTIDEFGTILLDSIQYNGETYNTKDFIVHKVRNGDASSWDINYGDIVFMHKYKDNEKQCINGHPLVAIKNKTDEKYTLYKYVMPIDKYMSMKDVYKMYIEQNKDNDSPNETTFVVGCLQECGDYSRLKNPILVKNNHTTKNFTRYNIIDLDDIYARVDFVSNKKM